MGLDSYKFRDHPQPTRGPRAHEPVEMMEGLCLFRVRGWRCPVCGREESRCEEDLPAGFIGLTCHGDAVMEGVEEPNE